jgi:hypothetical protein
MNLDARLRRDRKIEQMHRSGKDEAAIAARYGLSPTRVRTILVDRGLVTRREERDRDGIWGKEPGARIAAFYERQRRGAREARRLMEGSST